MSQQKQIGISGVTTRSEAARRFIFDSEIAKVVLPAGRVLDASNSRDPLNTGDIVTLRAGVLLGRITASKLWAPSILGTLSVAFASGTSMTVSVATAIELVRRIGTSGTFTLVGPPSAAGVVDTKTVTFSAVDTGTGVITVVDPTVAFIIGSLIGDTDGSQTIRGLLNDEYGVRVTDTDGVDIDSGFALAIGGQIRTANVVEYPSDTSLITFVQDALRDVGVGYAFDDDFE